MLFEFTIVTSIWLVASIGSYVLFDQSVALFIVTILSVYALTAFFGVMNGYKIEHLFHPYSAYITLYGTPALWFEHVFPMQLINKLFISVNIILLAFQQIITLIYGLATTDRQNNIYSFGFGAVILIFLNATYWFNLFDLIIVNIPMFIGKICDRSDFWNPMVWVAINIMTVSVCTKLLSSIN